MSRLQQLSSPPKLAKEDYVHALRHWQYDLLTLQQNVMRSGLRVIVNIEGMDAAGKGGAIRRLVRQLDPRSYKVYRIGAPDPRDQAKHYLYRFWQRMPSPGEMVIFDRSWYGRVLVERVEGIATKEQWQRAYREINEFERLLVDDGIVLVSLWFHIDADVQLQRFEQRLADPFKAWKMTDEDWRNRDRWDDYLEAAEAMFAETDTQWAPWTLIPGNNKRHARLLTIRAVVEAIRQAGLKQGMEPGDLQRVAF